MGSSSSLIEPRRAGAAVETKAIGPDLTVAAQPPTRWTSQRLITGEKIGTGDAVAAWGRDPAKPGAPKFATGPIGRRSEVDRRY